ncbi:MAG TPA: Crp/Fnr family transcriptional regulator [Spirochaetota bacterium]|nr:Crp/Fnr family transcriptional regulator [Spirochaetota bacterium]
MDFFLKKLAKVPLFNQIEPRELGNIIRAVTCKTKKYKQGAVIMRQDCTYENLYIIISGRCYGEMLDYAGKVIKIEDLPTPVTLAPAVLFAEQNKMPVSIITSAITEAVLIAKDDFFNICLRHRIILKNFLKLISNKFIFISNKLNFLQFKSLEKKVIHFILSLPADVNGIRYLPYGVKYLAELLAVTRPSLSRTLRQLQERGLLKREGKKIILAPEDKLPLL